MRAKEVAVESQEGGAGAETLSHECILGSERTKSEVVGEEGEL